MVENNMYNVEDFYKNGYFIVDDFLEEFYHKKLLNRFKEESEWTRIDQVRDHYKKGGPFEMNSKHFPNRDETYYLQGWRAKKLEEDAAWRKDYHDIFLSKISKLFKNEIKNDTTYIRTSGWLAHWIEQVSNNKIFRPTQIYTGYDSRKYNI